MKTLNDNQGAVNLLKQSVASVKSKHIDEIHQFARKRVSRKEVVFECWSTDEMVADCFTKTFNFCCEATV